MFIQARFKQKFFNKATGRRQNRLNAIHILKYKGVYIPAKKNMNVLVIGDCAIAKMGNIIYNNFSLISKCLRSVCADVENRPVANIN